MPRIVNVDEMLLWARRHGYPIPNNVLWLLCHYPEVKDSYHDGEATKKVDNISRQAAIDALHAHLMYRMGTESNKKRLDEWINSLPSAQQETIRCKDCKWRDENWRRGRELVLWKCRKENR